MLVDQRLDAGPDRRREGRAGTAVFPAGGRGGARYSAVGGIGKASNITVPPRARARGEHRNRQAATRDRRFAILVRVGAWRAVLYGRLRPYDRASGRSRRPRDQGTC